MIQAGIRFALVVPLLLGACSSSTLGGTGGRPGLGDLGGNPGTGGLATGGSPGTGGLATGGSPGTGGLATGGSGGPACSQPGAPIVTTDPPRRTFTWTFVAGAGGAGGASDAGTSDGAASSSCQNITALTDLVGGVSCVGSAWLQSRTTGPVIAFDDGSQLVWDGSTTVVPAPYVEQSGGDRVWVDFERRDFVATPVGGQYQTFTLEIRNGAGGTIRFMAQQGTTVPDLTDAQVHDLFGVTATSVSNCAYETGKDCIQFDRTELDHLLNITPPQQIPGGVLTQVATPNGFYNVVWSASTESSESVECTDAPAMASDNGFAASLEIEILL